MSCVLTLNSSRIPIQKTDLRDFFRRTNPATRKSSPKVVGTYMRRAGQPHGEPTQLTKTRFGGSVSNSRSFGGYFAWFACLWACRPGGESAKFGLRPWYLTSKPCFPRSGTLSQLWWACLLGARRLLSAWAGWSPSRYRNALAGGTEVLLVSRLAGNFWGLWIAGFANRFTRSSGMALSSTRACALTWHGSSPPEGRM